MSNAQSFAERHEELVLGAKIISGLAVAIVAIAAGDYLIGDNASNVRQTVNERVVYEGAPVVYQQQASDRSDSSVTDADSKTASEVSFK